MGSVVRETRATPSKCVNTARSRAHQFMRARGMGVRVRATSRERGTAADVCQKLPKTIFLHAEARQRAAKRFYDSRRAAKRFYDSRDSNPSQCLTSLF